MIEARGTEQREQRVHPDAHIVLVAEADGPQDLVEVLSDSVRIQSGWKLLKLVQNCPLHELEHQIPATSPLPRLQQVHQILMPQLLPKHTNTRQDHMKTILVS